jgi:hypothetical protein
MCQTTGCKTTTCPTMAQTNMTMHCC